MTEYGLLDLPEIQEKDLRVTTNQKPEVHDNIYFLLFFMQITKAGRYFRLGAFQATLESFCRSSS